MTKFYRPNPDWQTSHGNKPPKIWDEITEAEAEEFLRAGWVQHPINEKDDSKFYVIEPYV